MLDILVAVSPRQSLSWIEWISTLIWRMAAVGLTNMKRRVLWERVLRIETPSNSAQSPKFIDLPLEVLTEILTLVEWTDVLCARQTCHRLREASMARPVWLALVRWYTASIEPRPLWPEKPLAKHTARELEHLVLRWKSGKAGFAVNELDNVIPNQRHFFLSQSSHHCTFLVPGGRWFLVGTRCGSVQCFDLDAPTITAFTLVPTPFDEGTRAQIRISIDVQADAEYLTFHLGVVTRRMPTHKDPQSPDPSRNARWIQVWRVTSSLDEDGQVRSLNVEQLASFREEYKGDCDSFSLRGQHVAYTLFFLSGETGPFNDGSRIIIVDWTSCDSTSLAYPRRIISQVNASWLAVLPGDKLVCHKKNGLLLYDFTDAPTTNLLPSQYQHHISKFPYIDHLSFTILANSQPYIVHNSIRITIMTFAGVKGVVIPLSPGPDWRMESIDLSEGFPRKYVQIGYNCVVSLQDWPVATILQYGWPDQPAPAVASRKTIVNSKGMDCEPTVCFDESSGRLVVSGDVYEKQRILDLALSKSFPS